MTNTFLLVVFDGLRPDMMRPDTTPNLLRFAAMGTVFAHARSVFPSETRVCSATVATGCQPRRHGLVANRMAHPRDAGLPGARRRSVDTSQIEALMALEEELDTPLLQAPALGALLEAAGRDCVVLSSGTTGQSYLLNPTAAALGQVTLSAHGRHACSPKGAALFDTIDPPPAAPVARVAWIAELFRTRFLPDPPAATILWLCEPDSSGHHDGLGAAGNLAALRAADAAFGRILDDWQDGPQRDRLQIMVASDHGQATITEKIDVAAAMAGLALFDGCLLLAGSSGGVMVPDDDAARIAAIATWLTRQDWVGSVFAADGADLPPGVLPRSAVLCDHRHAAQVLFTLRAGPKASALGLAGTTLNDGALPAGAGTHGGLTAAEMHIVLMLAGSRVRAGTLSEWPAGLTDIAPTALALLGVGGAAAMDGRVLGEALTDGAEPDATPAAESWEAMEGDYRQRLARTRLGRHVYIDLGGRD